MVIPTADERVRRVCADIHVDTGRVVDLTWQLPTWNGLLSSNSTVQVGRPSCCFQPRNRTDVIAACRAALSHGLKISARGSGHHYGGASMADGALLLDLSALASVQVDPASRTARVGPAATARQLRSSLAPHGLHFPLPHLSDVGLSGYILGGGNGWGVRQWGAAADNVEEIEVVLLAGAAAASKGSEGEGNRDDAVDDHGCSGAGGGDGDAARSCRLVRVSAGSDPELFWGLCGGGAFLGVVTEFVLRLHPVPSCLPLIAATYPLSLLGELTEFFREFHSANPPSVEASISVVGADGDGSSSSGNGGGERGPVATVVVLACHAFAEPGSDQVEAAYGKLRALLPDARLSLHEGPVPYEEALSVLDSAWNWSGLCMYGHGIFVPVPLLQGHGGGDGATSDAAGTRGEACNDRGGVVAALAAAAARMTSHRSILLVCPSAPSRPGCTAREDAAAADTSVTAAEQCGYGPSDGGGPRLQMTHGSLGFRDTFYVGIYGMWTRSEGGPAADGDAAHVAWVRSCAAALEPYAAGLYVNEVMHDNLGQVRRSYEERTYARLLALKRRVDPRGLLRKL